MSQTLITLVDVGTFSHEGGGSHREVKAPQLVHRVVAFIKVREISMFFVSPFHQIFSTLSSGFLCSEIHFGLLKQTLHETFNTLA